MFLFFSPETFGSLLGNLGVVQWNVIDLLISQIES